MFFQIAINLSEKFWQFFCSALFEFFQHISPCNLIHSLLIKLRYLAPYCHQVTTRWSHYLSPQIGHLTLRCEVILVTFPLIYSPLLDWLKVFITFHNASTTVIQPTTLFVLAPLQIFLRIILVEWCMKIGWPACLATEGPCLWCFDVMWCLWCDVCDVMFVMWCLWCDVCDVMFVMWCLWCDVCVRIFDHHGISYPELQCTGQIFYALIFYFKTGSKNRNQELNMDFLTITETKFMSHTNTQIYYKRK